MNIQVMVPFRYQLFLEDLKYLVESGKISMSRIDDAVERILRVKFAAGLFEYPLSDRSLLDTVGCEVSLLKYLDVCSATAQNPSNCSFLSAELIHLASLSTFWSLFAPLHLQTGPKS